MKPQYFIKLNFTHKPAAHHSFSLLQYNINAYPTTVIFNKSSIHEYEGHHSADGILEFIQVRAPVRLNLTFCSTERRIINGSVTSVRFVSGPGEPCRGHPGPGLLPAAGEEKEANPDVDGGLLCPVVRTVPGAAPWVAEDGSGTLVFINI